MLKEVHHNDAVRDRPDLTPTLVESDEVGGGDQVADFGREVSRRELLNHHGAEARRVCAQR